MAAPKRDKQVNVRLTQAEHDVIRAAAFVEDRSEADLVRDVVLAFVEARQVDPEVQDGLKVLARRRAKKSGKLTELGAQLHAGGTA